MGSLGGVISSENHYNKQLNRCFVLVGESGRSKYTTSSNLLYDAVERSLLLGCISRIDSGRSCFDYDANVNKPISPDDADKRMSNYLKN